MAKNRTSMSVRRKRLLFMAGALVLSCILLETLSWCVNTSIEFKNMYSLREFQREVTRSSETHSNEAETIHPYLGWVSNPQLNSGTTLFGRKIPVNSLGFDDIEHGTVKRSPDRFIVALTGGSVAWQMSVAGEDSLRQELLQNPHLKGKQIEIVRLAKSGYKQPQQLMALNFVLALGNEFDAVVNVDGFNEIALAVCENDMVGVFAAYPRSWHARMQYAVDPRNHRIAFQLMRTKGLKQQIAQDRLDSWLNWSPTLNLIWWMRNNACENELQQLRLEIQDRRVAHGLGFAAVGPDQTFKTEAGLYSHLVDLWSNSSLQMNHLCRANKCIYIHVLQPNQYLPKSKPMGPDEQKLAINDTRKYGISIAKGYPLLIARGQNFHQHNLDFHDLTQLFVKTIDRLYEDGCCHYNQDGNSMLAREVAKLIAASLDRGNP